MAVDRTKTKKTAKKVAKKVDETDSLRSRLAELEKLYRQSEQRSSDLQQELKAEKAKKTSLKAVAPSSSRRGFEFAVSKTSGGKPKACAVWVDGASSLFDNRLPSINVFRNNAVAFLNLLNDADAQEKLEAVILEGLGYMWDSDLSEAVKV